MDTVITKPQKEPRPYEGLALYMEIGSYEAMINKYANPSVYKEWNKYIRLKRKILQWQLAIN